MLSVEGFPNFAKFLCKQGDIALGVELGVFLKTLLDSNGVGRYTMDMALREMATEMCDCLGYTCLIEDDHEEGLIHIAVISSPSTN